jgi:hypothetical protein
MNPEQYRKFRFDASGSNNVDAETILTHTVDGIFVWLIVWTGITVFRSRPNVGPGFS